MKTTRIISTLLLMLWIPSVFAVEANKSHSGMTAKPIPLQSESKTVIGQDLQYPKGTPMIKAFEIEIAPGQQTSLHRHAIPLFAYVVSGELEVDYGSKGKRMIKAGTSFMEAIDWCHYGKALGNQPVKIIGVYLGQQKPDTALSEDCKKAN
jgi:quercetin dioxygenase-like cupin family protein